MKMPTITGRVRTFAIAVAILMTAPGALAQGLLSKGGDAPVTINADNGIEWVRDEKKYIARGNASANRNDATVNADTLTAFYREKQDGGGQEIFRVDADGNVKISTDAQQAVGDKAVYHVDKAVFVLVGKNLKLTSSQGVLTARDSLEYWEEKRLAVARGDAVVVQDGQRVRADVMTAHMDATADSTAGKTKPQKKKAKTNPKKPKASAEKSAGGDLGFGGGDSQIRQVDAFGNVHISLQKAIVRGDTGVYVPSRGVATLCGNVRITSGKNQLNGKCAEVNLRTGIYKLTGRAKGLVQPRREQQ